MPFNVKSATFDINSILRKSQKWIASSKNLQLSAEKKFTNIFNRSKRRMLSEFYNNKISLELQASRNDPFGGINISNTLDGYGNLYSFLGFDNGRDPVGELGNVMDINTTPRYAKYVANKGWFFSYTVPSKKDIRDATQMDWEPGNSWAEGVEKGVTNLSHYLNKKNVGRSRGGLQAPHEINEDLVFSPKPYLTEILGNFRNAMNNYGVGF